MTKMYQIYDVTDECILEKGLTFTQTRDRIASYCSENEMQYQKILRAKSMKQLNEYGSGLGFYVETTRKPIKIYGFYDGDRYVCSGTVQQIAEYTGKSIPQLRRIATPGYKRRFGERDDYLQMVEIGEEE